MLEKGMERVSSPPVLLVVALICLVYYTVVFLVIGEWLGMSSAPGLFNALCFSSITFMAVINYGFCIFRDPGKVPLSYMPDVEDDRVSIHEVKRKGGDLRYCQKCSVYKPPRAHHCRVCKQCVLRMDHHCIWINNCVGHNNYKDFFLFVFYIVFACCYALILIAGYALDFLRDTDESRRASAQQPINTSVSTSALLKVLSATIIAPLTVALVVLLGWHIYLILNNKTTIEYHEGVRTYSLVGKAGYDRKHPYDIGYFSNLSAVLGPNPITWLCPNLVGQMGSGLMFPVACDDVAHHNNMRK